MGRRNQGGKKEKIKCATHLPALSASAFRPGSSTILPPIHSIKVKKLKATDHGFKVNDSSFRSNVNAAAIAAFTWKEPSLSESQMDTVWDRVHQSAGWEQGYVDSFVNQGKLPPENDPELPKAKGKGVRNAPSYSFNSLIEIQDKAMHEWTKHIDTFLRGLISLEGRGQFASPSCVRCRIPDHEGQYRCLTCDNLGLVCHDCMLSTHQHMPFHRIEVRSSFYENCSD